MGAGGVESWSEVIAENVLGRGDDSREVRVDAGESKGVKCTSLGE